MIPTGKHKRLLRLGIFLSAILAAVFCALNFTVPCLVLSNQDTGRVVFCAPAAAGAEFAVSFTHSVNKSLVTEYFRLENGQIYLDSLRFYSFGAGMPEGPEAGQTMRVEPDGALVIENYQRPLPELCYSVGRVAGHVLHWQGREIPLDSLAEPGQTLRFSCLVYPRPLVALGIYPPAD